MRRKTAKAKTITETRPKLTAISAIFAPLRVKSRLVIISTAMPKGSAKKHLRFQIVTDHGAAEPDRRSGGFGTSHYVT
jgi:hypothetical protein